MNKTQFEWQADEDQFLGKPSPQSGQSPSKRWRLVVLILLIIIAAASLTVSIVDRRQRRLEENVQQDVRLNFDLWLQALRAEDSELHAHLLSTADRKWRLNQKQLFNEDLILGRSFLGFYLQDEAIMAPEIGLAPDFQQAVVTFEQAYSASEKIEIEDPVRLQHTAVFAIKDANWLQVPPDEDFWGDWERFESDLLIVYYPARDAELAQRISQQLEIDLQNICAVQVGLEGDAGDRCAPLKPLIFELSTAPDSLAAQNSAVGSLLLGPHFQMPAPSIAGLPLDESSFQAYYLGYTRTLLEQVRTAVNFPIPLPEQVVRTLCYNQPNSGPRLYAYDPILGGWEAELPDRSFRFLESLPEQQGLILDEIGDDLESWHSRLIQKHEGAEKLLLEEITNEAAVRVIIPAPDAGSHLLLRRMIGNQSTYRYSALDLRSCAETGCAHSALPGHAVWSPGGQQTLLQIGSEIYLGDADGQIQTVLGTGFNPFWLDDETAATIRFSEQSSGLVSRLVMRQIASDVEYTVFDANDLAEQAGIAGEELFIKYVTPNPADPRMLLVQASGLRDHAGEYFIFSVRLPPDRLRSSAVDITLHLQREGSPGGDAGQVVPTGYLPFSPSPDGRWIVISELKGYDTATRTSLLHDLQQNRTTLISEGEPVFPAQFPSYDWSDDGRWLVIAGDGFFHLLAPEYDYEQLVAHDFDTCLFTRWSD